MQPADFVQTLLDDENDFHGSLTLKRILQGLRQSDGIILMGGGRVNHSNHKDHTSGKSSDCWIHSCHKDLVHHKDTC